MEDFYGKDPSMGVIQQEEVANLQDELAKRIEVAITAEDSELQKQLAEVGRRMNEYARRQAPAHADQLKANQLKCEQLRESIRGQWDKLRAEELSTAGNYDPSMQEPKKSNNPFKFKKGISHE